MVHERSLALRVKNDTMMCVSGSLRDWRGIGITGNDRFTPGKNAGGAHSVEKGASAALALYAEQGLSLQATRHRLRSGKLKAD